MPILFARYIIQLKQKKQSINTYQTFKFSKKNANYSQREKKKHAKTFQFGKTLQEKKKNCTPYA